MHVMSVITAIDPRKSQFLGDAAQSLISQDLLPGWDWEWVICVDGVTPRLDLPDDERVRVIEVGRPSGPALCRNIAAANSTGRVLRNLDADDVLLPDAISSDIAAVGNGAYEWTTSEALDLLPNGQRVPFVHGNGDRVIAVGEVARQWAKQPILDIHPTTMAISRDLYWRNGGYAALPRSEDVSLLARVNMHSEGIHRHNPSLLYRKWDGQMTARNPDANYLRVREAMVAALLGHSE